MQVNRTWGAVIVCIYLVSDVRQWLGVTVEKTGGFLSHYQALSVVCCLIWDFRPLLSCLPPAWLSGYCVLCMIPCDWCMTAAFQVTCIHDILWQLYDKWLSGYLCVAYISWPLHDSCLSVGIFSPFFAIFSRLVSDSKILWVWLLPPSYRPWADSTRPSIGMHEH